MNQYGKVALKAVEQTKNGKAPPKAWLDAAKDVFVDKKSSIEKSCPRGTFLGLAEDGYIKGIPSGNYTRSTKNKAYGLAALQQLKMSPELAKNKKELWLRSCNDQPKVQNGQMDVVLALWDHKLLI